MSGTTVVRSYRSLASAWLGLPAVVHFVVVYFVLESELGRHKFVTSITPPKQVQEGHGANRAFTFQVTGHTHVQYSFLAVCSFAQLQVDIMVFDRLGVLRRGSGAPHQ